MMNKVYCRYCGQQIDEDASFCTYCGQRQTITKPTPNHMGVSLMSRIRKILSCIKTVLFYPFKLIKRLCIKLKDIFKRGKKKFLFAFLAIVLMSSIIGGIVYYDDEYEPRKSREAAYDELSSKLNSDDDSTVIEYSYEAIMGRTYNDFSVFSHSCGYEIDMELRRCAFNNIESRAYNNNHECQFLLGLLYHNGLYVAEDDTKAAYWWNESAKGGYVPAFNNIGVSYLNGQGVKKNLKMAAYWLKKGAEAGFDYAQTSYGDLFIKGIYEDSIIVPKDIEQAKYWWRKAAEQGNREAKERLQKIYD